MYDWSTGFSSDSVVASCTLYCVWWVYLSCSHVKIYCDETHRLAVTEKGGNFLCMELVALGEGWLGAGCADCAFLTQLFPCAWVPQNSLKGNDAAAHVVFVGERVHSSTCLYERPKWCVLCGVSPAFRSHLLL